MGPSCSECGFPMCVLCIFGIFAQSSKEEMDKVVCENRLLHFLEGGLKTCLEETEVLIAGL